MVRRPKEVPVVQVHHERNQHVTVCPEIVEGLIQSCLRLPAIPMIGLYYPIENRV